MLGTTVLDAEAVVDVEELLELLLALFPALLPPPALLEAAAAVEDAAEVEVVPVCKVVTEMTLGPVDAEEALAEATEAADEELELDEELDFEAEDDAEEEEDDDLEADDEALGVLAVVEARVELEEVEVVFVEQFLFATSAWAALAAGPDRTIPVGNSSTDPARTMPVVKLVAART